MIENGNTTIYSMHTSKLDSSHSKKSTKHYVAWIFVQSSSDFIEQHWPTLVFNACVESGTAFAGSVTRWNRWNTECILTHILKLIIVQSLALIFVGNSATDSPCSKPSTSRVPIASFTDRSQPSSNSLW